MNPFLTKYTLSETSANKLINSIDGFSRGDICDRAIIFV